MGYTRGGCVSMRLRRSTRDTWSGGRACTTKVNATMVKRRKVLLGMGSLAAGSAAAMGTGALSATEAERNISGRVVGDQKAYLKLRAGAAGGDGNNWAVEFDGPEIGLSFDDSDDVGGDGLNADAVSYFDQVFNIRHGGEDYLDVFCTTEYDRITFYRGRGDGRQSLMGSGNSRRLTPQDLSGNKGGLSNLYVGVKIDLRGVTDTGEVFNGDDDFRVHAEFAGQT